MKKTIWIKVAILTLLTVLTGCTKQTEVVVVAKKSQISGQVFVATQGGESRKLGDIPIALYNEETILNFQTNIIVYLQETRRKIAKVDTLIVAEKQSVVADEQSIVADKRLIVADQQALDTQSEIVARKLDAIERSYAKNMGQLREKWKTLETYRAQRAKQFQTNTSLANAKVDTARLIGYAWPKEDLLIPDKAPAQFRRVVAWDRNPLVGIIKPPDSAVGKRDTDDTNDEAQLPSTSDNPPRRLTAVGTASSGREAQNWFIEMRKRNSSHAEGYLILCRAMDGNKRIGLLPFADRLGNSTRRTALDGESFGNNIVILGDMVEVQPGYFPFRANQGYPVLTRDNQNLGMLFSFETFTQVVSVAQADVKFTPIADYNKAIEAMTQDLKSKADKALGDGHYWAVRDIFMTYRGDYAQDSIQVREKLANEYAGAIEKQARMADRAFQDAKDDLEASRRNQRDAEYRKNNEFNEPISNEINTLEARIDAAKARLRDSAETIDQLQKARYGLTVFDLRNLIAVHLGQPFKTSKTDAEGQFSFEVVEPNRYALLTFGERAVLNSTEHYLWLVWIEPKNSEYPRALLSGSNLLSGDNPDRFLSLQTVK